MLNEILGDVGISCAYWGKIEMVMTNGDLEAGTKILLQDNKADRGVTFLWLATTDDRKDLP